MDKKIILVKVPKITLLIKSPLVWSLFPYKLFLDKSAYSDQVFEIIIHSKMSYIINTICFSEGLVMFFT